MQIQSASQAVNPMNTSEVNRPKGPPPPPRDGGVPPGLESAVSTLSSEEQSAVTDILASLSKDQQATLKTQLDSLGDNASSMSQEELGGAFKDILTSLSAEQSDSSSLNKIDVFA